MVWQTTYAGVVTVLVALVSHKWVESVAVVSRFAQASPLHVGAMLRLCCLSCHCKDSAHHLLAAAPVSAR